MIKTEALIAARGPGSDIPTVVHGSGRCQNSEVLEMTAQ